jgi:hypothetical protein
MFVTAADVIAYVGVKTPSQAETDWAETVAAAVESGVNVRLNGAVIVDPSPAMDELHLVAVYAAGEAYKRKEVPFGGSGFADTQSANELARDYLASVAPQIDRYGNGPGIG